MSFERHLPDDAATAAFGAELAQTLVPGDIVMLEGPLGAGKTALARAVIRTLVGRPDLEVPSPTFAIVQPYSAVTGPVLHADLYRIGAPEDLDELGLLDDPQAIVLVEWAERAPQVVERATRRVTLTLSGTGRLVAVRS
jgi:tRNA threonylcarbamoyladenosine biosynthesis protein TsaE